MRERLEDEREPDRRGEEECRVQGVEGRGGCGGLRGEVWEHFSLVWAKSCQLLEWSCAFVGRANARNNHPFPGAFSAEMQCNTASTQCNPSTAPHKQK